MKAMHHAGCLRKMLHNLQHLSASAHASTNAELPGHIHGSTRTLCMKNESIQGAHNLKDQRTLTSTHVSLTEHSVLHQ